NLDAILQGGGDAQFEETPFHAGGPGDQHSRAVADADRNVEVFAVIPRVEVHRMQVALFHEPADESVLTDSRQPVERHVPRAPPLREHDSGRDVDALVLRIMRQNWE